MKDVLVIELRDRAVCHHDVRRTFRTREHNVFIADSFPKAVQMLRTAIMDEVVVDLNGPQENAAEFIKQIAKAHPRVRLVQLPIAEEGTAKENRLETAMTVPELQTQARNNEPQTRGWSQLHCDLYSGACFDNRICLHQGGNI